MEGAWRVLEFYSGIGGMRYSLMRAGVEATVVEAFDINDKANDVYQHNFAHRPYQKSDTHKQMLEILAHTDFITQEYILTPLQFGVPYSRPRYYCLAKRKPSAFQNPNVNSQLLWTPSPFLGSKVFIPMDTLDESHERWKEWLHFCEPVESFLEFNITSQPGTAYQNVSEVSFETLEKKHKGGDSCENCLTKYVVPLSLIERWGSAMDIVYPDSKRCCCFTKSYFRYVKGTGSLLATIQAQKEGKVSSLKEQGLRYFTPREVANLHSLPEQFQFPEHISLKQQYALLGNSLSIAVIASLLHYLFTEPSE